MQAVAMLLMNKTASLKDTYNKINLQRLWDEAPHTRLLVQTIIAPVLGKTTVWSYA